MLVLAPARIAISSFNLRRSTPVLPIVIGRPNPSPHRPLPKDAVNARRLQTAAPEIPIASDAPSRHTSRGFLPWRFAYAGPQRAPRHHHGAGIRKPSQTRKSLVAERSAPCPFAGVERVTSENPPSKVA